MKAAYNHAQYLDERREMMQRWADYLDQLQDLVPKYMPMPERFKRDLPTYLCDTIVDWADAEQDAGRSTEPYFG